MKLTINISKRVYDYILKKNTIVNGDRLEVAESIINGTKPKIGHWIKHKYNGVRYIECSECSIWFLKMHLVYNSYCPNCGTKMQEELNDDEKA